MRKWCDAAGLSTELAQLAATLAEEFCAAESTHAVLVAGADELGYWIPAPAERHTEMQHQTLWLELLS